MNKRFFLFLFFAITAYAQQTSVAVLPSDANGAVLNNDELEALTDKMRESALKILPANAFVLLKQDVVVKRLGGAEKYIKECSESSCIVDLGKKAQVDYVSQASVGKLGDKIRLKVELYSVRTEGLVGMLNGEAENIYGLIDIVEKRVPTEVFGKIPGVSVGKPSAPSFAGGISGLEKTADYEFGGGKRYLVNLITEPSGALMSFNGVPAASCPKTPCKLELVEGNVRIIAALEQHETVDTTVFVSRNNQSIAISLRTSFGILEIKPAYLEGIGINEPWSLSINGKLASSWENRLSPNKYKVELGHRCYEVLSFEAGINKGSHEIFDMSKYIKLKKGGLDLSALRNGEPVVEPVFVNGKQVGDTPFSDAVPLCSEIEIGENRDVVNVALKHNEKISYKVKLYDSTPVPADAVPKFEEPGKTSFWIALALDVAGAGLISAGFWANYQMVQAREDYEKCRSQDCYDSTWKEAESSRSSRNMFYVIGGVLLASGIGVHIWF